MASDGLKFVNSFIVGGSTAASETHGTLILPPVAVWGNLAIHIGAWAFLMWPGFLPLGRPCIAMVFAAMACGLRELCHVAWPKEGYPTVDIFGKVNPTPIALLFGLMLVNAYLKDTGLWKRVEHWLDSPSPGLLLLKLCLVSALTSAFLLNDTTCLVLTPVVLSLCSRHGARSNIPYLLAVSTSSNIGSCLTTIGNPQNALIASIAPGITFVGFLQTMLLPVIAGLAINTVALFIWFRHEMVFERTPDIRESELEQVGDPEVGTQVSKKQASCSWGVYITVVATVLIAMVMGWACSLATDDVALAAGSILMMVRSVRRKAAGEHGETETEFALGAIDYSILVLFIGQFILVGATVDTGLPQKAFQGILGDCAQDLAASPACLLWFAAVVLLLSNLISNVPVILMLQPLLATQPAGTVTSVWVLCAWVATVSGNFTMLGSAANLIVAHSAERNGEKGFTATAFCKFSVLPTLGVTAAGVFLMPPVGPDWMWILATGILGLLGLLAAIRSCGKQKRHVAMLAQGFGMPREALGLVLLSMLSAGEGLGPFAGAWLTTNPIRDYRPGEIGTINAVQQVLAMLAQPFLGKLVDTSTWKRSLLGLGSLFVAAGTCATVFAPLHYWLQLLVQVPMAAGLTLVPLTLNSLSLGTTTTAEFTQQIAFNNVGIHTGTVASSAAMALCAIYGPKIAIMAEDGQKREVASPVWSVVPFVMSLLTIAALGIIRYSKIDHRRAAGLKTDSEIEEAMPPSTMAAKPPEKTIATASGVWVLFGRRVFWLSLLLAFLFNFANMAQLQLLVQQAAYLLPDDAIPFTSAAQIVAHLGMLGSAVIAGKIADSWGRKPLLLVACVCVTVRALLTAAVDFWWILKGGSPWLGLVPCEGLDGICAGLWGVLVVILARDVSVGTGSFSLALGCVQASFSAGGIASSVAAGQLADLFGFASAFLLLAAAGLGASILACFFPETRGLSFD